MTAVLVLLGLVALAVVLAIAIYNGLVTRRNAYRNAYSQIDVQLKRRHDLVPNLVETAKGYLRHERETLEAVVAARNGAAAAGRAAAANPGDPQAMAAMAGAEGTLTGVLHRFLAVAEAYPDLKANQNFLQLQRDLTDTEDRVAASRRFYNANVRALNTKVETVPSNVVAGLFGIHRAEYFEADDEQVRAAPQVSFGTPGSTPPPPATPPA